MPALGQAEGRDGGCTYPPSLRTYTLNFTMRLTLLGPSISPRMTRSPAPDTWGSQAT